MRPTVRLGDFEITVGEINGAKGLMEITCGEKTILSIPPKRDWLVAYARGYELPESRGFFFPKAPPSKRFEAGPPSALILEERRALLEGCSDAFEWSLSVEVNSAGVLAVSLKTNMPRVVLHSGRNLGRIFGLGNQFTHVDFNGRRVPMISQEPGIGRGVWPLTFLMNKMFRAGGCDVQSSAPSTFFMTDQWSGYFLDTSAVSFIDFTDAQAMAWDVNSRSFELFLFSESNPRDLLTRYTDFVGKMKPLPDWVHQGAIVGLQGGSERFESIAKCLDESGAQISAYWLQDWVGQRKTSIGWQLWWNWELDREHYPRWLHHRTFLSERGIRILGYVNPFLVDVASRDGVKRDLFSEAKSNGYLVVNREGLPYEIGNTSFGAYLVDLTNSDARRWLKDVILEQVLGEGLSGFMADFGEALPADAVLHDGTDAALFHNQYPIEWARLVDEVFEESGRQDLLAFHRSGFHRSAAHTRLFWLGDQLVSWEKSDGIHSAVSGLLSGGLSGFAYSHSDIGGYTSTDLLPFGLKVPGVSFTRGAELLMRWMELNCFTAVFRSHEGNQPASNVQVFDTPRMRSFFSYFSQIFAALFEYRKGEMSVGHLKGYPLVRPVWFHAEEELGLLDEDKAFALGRFIYVYPVLEKGVTQKTLSLPRGEYRHLFTGDTYLGGQPITVDTPLARPAVFVSLEYPLHRELISKIQEVDRSDLEA